MWTASSWHQSFAPGINPGYASPSAVWLANSESKRTPQQTKNPRHIKLGLPKPIMMLSKIADLARMNSRRPSNAWISNMSNRLGYQDISGYLVILELLDSPWNSWHDEPVPKYQMSLLTNIKIRGGCPKYSRYCFGCSSWRRQVHALKKSW